MVQLTSDGSGIAVYRLNGGTLGLVLLLLSTSINVSVWSTAAPTAPSASTSKYVTVVYLCNGWDICMNGTTSAPKSVLRYVVDKVKLIVPI